MNIKIVAVVVTYNRLALLQDCISSLRDQTYKLDQIIIVNNSSNDGTVEWLNTQNDLQVITQENLGGAGGFHTGIKMAYKKGYDWIFCTEDEIVLDRKCIEILLEFTTWTKVSALAPVIYSYEKLPLYSEILSFNTDNYRHSKRYVHRNSDTHNYCKYLKIFSCTFEGLFLNSKCVEDIGLPNKDIFIWFDDVEYCSRLNSFGNIYLITNAKIYKNKINNNSDSNEKTKNAYLKEIYGIRNLVFIEKSTAGRFYIKILSYIFYLLRFYKYYLRNRKSLKKIGIGFFRSIIHSLRYFVDGYKGKLGEIKLI